MLNYRQRKTKKYWIIAGLTIGAIFLLFVLGSFWRQWLTGPLIFFSQPLWQVSDNLGTFLTVESQGLKLTKQELLIENKKLREENDKLRIQLLARQGIEADNLKLRAILGRNNNQLKPIGARVIFLPNFIPYNNLLLDLGSKNSSRILRPGDLVVANGDVLVGRLAEIGETYSKVKLLSAEANLSVVIGNKNLPAVANGSGAGNFTIILPKDTPVALGDRVMAPLLNNYLIGTVGHIEKLASRPTQTILVGTPLNLFQLKWLEIYDVKA